MVRRFSYLLALTLFIFTAGCDNTVENNASIEGNWTGTATGVLATDEGTVSEEVELEVTYEEAEDGELSGTGVFRVYDDNDELKETVQLSATGLRSSNTVESAFVSETDTAVYNGSVKKGGRQIEGQLDWNRHESTANVVLNRQ